MADYPLCVFAPLRDHNSTQKHPEADPVEIAGGRPLQASEHCVFRIVFCGVFEQVLVAIVL